MSRLLDRAVEQLAKLPTIGERSAMRLALHLLKQSPQSVLDLAEAITEFRTNVKYCKRCNNISDEQYCSICSDKGRDGSVVCVVENIKDVISIESTEMFRGHYHVLGGVISPMLGISPSQLKIDLLVDNIKQYGVKEVILALNSSIESETTLFYISRRLKDTDVKVSNIARGIGFGDQLDYADEMTLVHAINNRTEIKR